MQRRRFNNKNYQNIRNYYIIKFNFYFRLTFVIDIKNNSETSKLGLFLIAMVSAQLECKNKDECDSACCNNADQFCIGKEELVKNKVSFVLRKS